MQKSLTSRMAGAISLLILLVIVLITLIFLGHFESQLKNSVSRQQLNTLTMLARDLDMQLLTARQLIDGLSKSASAGVFSSPYKAQQFIELNPGHAEVFRHGIYLFTLDGRLLASKARPPELPFQVLPAELIQALFKHRQPIIVPPLNVNRLELQMVIAPVFDFYGEPAGFVAGTEYLFSDQLLGRLADVTVGETGYLFLFDRNGQVLAHPNPDHVQQSVISLFPADIIDKALSGYQGSLSVQVQEQPQLLTFKDLRNVNWVLASCFPEVEAYAAIHHTRQITIFAIVLVTGLSLLAVWFLMRQLSAPLSLFTRQVQSVSRGDRQQLTLPPSSPTELTTLGNAFNQLLADLQSQTHKIQEQQSFLESLLQNTAIACFALDPEHRVLLWNRACAQLTGIPAEQLVGSRDHWTAFYDQPRPCLADLILDHETDKIASYYSNFGSSPLTPGGFQAEGWFPNIGGQDRYLLISSVPVYRASGELLAAIETLEDISELRRSHDEINQTLSLLNATLEATADGIVVVNPEGQIVRHNQRAAEMWAMEHKLAETSNFTSLNKWIFSQLRDPLKSSKRIKDIIEQPGQEIFEVLEFKDGRCFEWTSRPQWLNQQIIGRVWSFHDISRQRLLEMNLRQAQKMEAVGQLAGGIAHDFNNLLTIINGYSDVISNSLPAGAEEQKYAELVLQAGLQAADLTGQLLTFSRRQLLRPQVLNLNELIQKNQKLLRHMLREDMRLQLQLEEPLRPVKTDPNQMEQVLVNLVVNGRDAMSSGGRLVIMTASAKIDDKLSEKFPEAEPGAYLRLSVVDDGCGMPAEVQARIFEPFYTTKERGKGTGLGLATVYGIVKQSGGYITVDSAPGEGTSFNIYLPFVTEPISSTVVEVPSSKIGSGRILVVENETDLRNLAVASLQKKGYTTYGAANAEQAQQIIAREPPFDLLLSDIIMSGTNGLELAKTLRRQHAELKILLMTGYSELQELGIDEDLPFPILQKPFLPEELVNFVQMAIEA